MATGQFQGRVIGQKEVGPQRQFVGLELKGSDALKAVLEDMKGRAPRALASALFREANYIVRDAKRLVPTDTGALKTSGHVEKPEINGSKISVSMGFGGVAGGKRIGSVQGPVMPGTVLTKQGERDPAGYALYVHEDLTAHHDSGQAKYLEQPALEHAASLEANLAADLRGRLEKKSE